MVAGGCIPYQNFKMAMVADLGEWRDGRWDWSWDWRRRLFLWEEELVKDIATRVGNVALKEDGEYRWVWKADASRVYTVKSAYDMIVSARQHIEDPIFKRLWRSFAPLKVEAFVWKLVLNWLPSAENLSIRVAIILWYGWHA